MAINAFQTGQQFALLQDRRQQDLAEGRRRLDAIDALIARYGPEAGAAAEFSMLQGGERAQERIALARQQEARLAAGQRAGLAQADRAAQLAEDRFGLEREREARIAGFQGRQEERLVAQQAAEQERQARLDAQADEDRQRRLVAIDALRELYGPGADAPEELNTLRRLELAGRQEERLAEGQQAQLEQADRAAQLAEDRFGLDVIREGRVAGFQERQENRLVAQQQAEQGRQARLDQQADADRARNNQLIAARQTVNFFRAGLQQGATPAELVQRAGPALEALSVTPEQREPLIEFIASDPEGALNQLDAAITQQQGPRRAIGNPIPVRLQDGQTALMQTFTDGSTQLIQGATPLQTELAAERSEIARGRLDVARGTLDARLSENDLRTLTGTRAELNEVKEARTFNETTVNAARTVTRDISTIFDLARTAAGFGGDTFADAATRAFTAQVLGTDVRGIQRLIDSVKSNIGIDTLLRIKRSGAGLGQVPQSQLETLQSILGNLDVTRDPNLLLRDLDDIQRLYTGIIAKAEESNVRLNDRELQLLRRRNIIEDRNFQDTPNTEMSLDELLNRYAPEGG